MAETTKRRTFSVRAGQVVTFKACFWDEHWEYDCPGILYSPVKRYEICGGHGDFMGMVESVAFDLCQGVVGRDFHASDFKEFEWRQWNAKGFARRRCWHYEADVRFFRDEEGEMDFEVIADREIWKGAKRIEAP